MAHSGDIRDKAPLINALDISAVARQRPVKVKNTRTIAKNAPSSLESDNVLHTPTCPVKYPIRIMAEPRAIGKNEERLATPLDVITLNLFDDRLGYYIDASHRIYHFEGPDLLVVGKYIVGESKLRHLTDDEIKTVTTLLKVRYVYDNNYFVRQE